MSHVCGKVIFAKASKRPSPASVPFLLWELFWEKKKVKGKKSKKVNPLYFIVVKVKNTYFGPKRIVRGRPRERERGLFSPVLGRVLEPETNPLRLSMRFLKFVAMVLKKIKQSMYPVFLDTNHGSNYFCVENVK